jgi:hypothetical protein
MRLLVACAAATLGLAGSAWPAPLARASGGGVDVFVGYADTARPHPKFFPTPWDGDPGVTFEGCTGNCVFDAGAVRIVNNSGSPVRIDSVAVKISTCTFSMWAPASIAPGGQLIVTQTASGGSDGCASDGTMDTSDVGPGGSDYAGNCTPDGLFPQVAVSIDGTVSTFTDNQVLNTGGRDLADCPPMTNESTQWTPIGHVACAGSELTLAPASQHQDTGTDAKVTATFVNSCGDPLQGAAVDFGVTAGPDAGRTGTGVTGADGRAAFSYPGNASGIDTVQASITNPAGVIPSNTVQVIWDRPIAAQGGQSFTGIEPAAVQGTVATFTDPDPGAQPADYTAAVGWGDGSPASAGTISGPPGGPFTITGSHTYSDEGSYTITVTITDTDNPANTATVTDTDTATITDASLTASGISPAPISGQSYGGPVATFTDANAATSSTADFTATIDWGDGSPATAGTVTGSGGSYTVAGDHTYTGTGYFTITVHITDDGGSTADAQTKALIYGTAQGGNFVIGDRNATTGNAVTFWGARWWKLNTLSGSTAPASFKGFEDQPPRPGCGQNWTTGPGNATPPPPGPLPGYMAIIVSSTITQSGSVISGNTPGMVVVKTSPDYAPDPGHPGTGTVIAKIC